MDRETTERFDDVTRRFDVVDQRFGLGTIALHIGVA